MELTIEQALGDQWAMFYHSQWPVEDLQPVCTLEQSVRTVNQQLQSVRDLSQWKYAHQDEIARLLERELERDKRDIERAELIAEAMSKAKTKSDFIKILTM